MATAPIKTGWTDAGNNLVTNTATGQTVDQNHPLYTSAGGATDSAAAPPPVSAPAPASSPYGTAVGGGETAQASLPSTSTPASVPFDGGGTAPAPVAAPSMPPGATDMGNNLVKLANGQVVPRDHPLFLAAMQAAGGGAPTGGGPAPAGTPAAGGGAPAITAGDVQNKTANVGATAAQGTPTTVAQSFQQALVNRLNPGAVNAQSPEIAPAIQANNLAEQRGMERNRAMLAERAAANGQDLSGGFESQLLGLAQDRAGREGEFTGNAVQHANDLQQTNMTNALGQVGNLLTGNANRDQASSQFSQDLNLRDKALQQQGQLGQSDIDLRSKLGEGQLNLGLLSQLLQNSQFGQSLGQQGAIAGAGMDQSGVLGLLGLLP